MKQTKPNRWDGKIYDPHGTAFTPAGGIYEANITLKNNVLEVRGCWAPFLCGGQDWTRLTDPNTPPLPPATVSEPPKGMAASKKSPATGSPAAAAVVDPVCSNVARLVPRTS
jgi:hypothetical protein